MEVSELKKGRKYHYTAATERIEVVYKHETINGYMFEGEGKTEILTKNAVYQHIEEI